MKDEGSIDDGGSLLLLIMRFRYLQIEKCVTRKGVQRKYQSSVNDETDGSDGVSDTQNKTVDTFMSAELDLLKASDET